MVRLVFLGKFGDMAPAGLREVALPPEVKTLSDLKSWIARDQPALGQAMEKTPVRLVVNQSVAQDMSHTVSDGDEVAFLPPMSGG